MCSVYTKYLPILTLVRPFLYHNIISKLNHIWTNLAAGLFLYLKDQLVNPNFPVKLYSSAAKSYYSLNTNKYEIYLNSSLTVVYPEEECPVTSIIRPVELVPPPRPHLLHGHPVGDPDLDLRQMAPGHGAVLVHLRPTASNSGRLQVLL